MRRLSLIVPSILLVGALIFIGLGLLNLQQVKNFPEVEATVTKVEQEIADASDPNGVNETVWVHYYVNADEHEEVLQFHGTGKYKVGDTIKVRYNPDKTNYVTAGTSSTSYIYIALGAVFALGGIAMLVRILKNR